MNALSVILFLIILIGVIAGIYVIISEHQKSVAQESEQKINQTLFNLHQDYLKLNNESLEAYKAMIRASYEAARNKQDTP